MNIAEYKEKIESYERDISAFSEKIADAQKNLIVAQTRIETCEGEINTIKEQCKERFGVDITELDGLIQKSIAELDKVVMQIHEVQNNGVQAAQEEEEVAC